MAGTTKGGKTTSGRTGAKKPASSKSKKQTQNRRQEPDTGFIRGEVILIASFALAVLLFLSNFHLCGVAGDYLRKVQLGIFGMTGFLAPVLLFVGTCFAMSNQGNPIAALKLTAAVAGVLTLCGLTEMIFGGGYKEGQTIAEAFIRSSQNGMGGGLIGGLLAQGLGSVVGVVGTYLILLVVFAICCVCVTEKSLVALVKKEGGKAYRYAREDASRRRVIHEEKKEERRRLKEERRVRGVNLNSTRLGQDQDWDGTEPEEGYGADGYGDPEYDGDGYGSQDYGEDGYDGGGYGEPGYGENGYDGDGYGEPGYGENGYDGDGYEDAGYEAPQYEAGRRAYHEEESFETSGSSRKKQGDSVKKAVPETASRDMPPEDIFTGKISLPPDYTYPQEEDDSPFDADDVLTARTALQEAWQDMADAAMEEDGWDTAADQREGQRQSVGSRGETDGIHLDMPRTRRSREDYDRQRSEGYGQEYGAGAVHPYREGYGGRTEDLYRGSNGEEPERFYQGSNGDRPEDLYRRNSGEGPEYERSCRETYGENQETPYDESYESYGGELGTGSEPDYGAGQESRYPDRNYQAAPESHYIDNDYQSFEGGEETGSPYYSGNRHMEEPPYGGQSTEIVDDFEIPEETKRVVTANGKIIENDTEALKKKLESRRQESRDQKAKDPGDAAYVAAQIQEKQVIKKEYQFPPVTLLKRGSKPAGAFAEQEYKETAIKLQQTLKNFGVGVTVTNISCGPAVTRYELRPEQGVKVSKIVGLTDDIKLSLAAADIRIEAPIPGRSAVGIEVPNKENTTVYLREIFESEDFKKASSHLSFAVGKDIGGQVVVTDIAKMPHLLIAGATGSGKSVCINTLIMSILYKASPDDVKMIMVDPKVVELSAYNGIPHLLIPVVTDPKKASGALNWAVAEMMSRYDKFAQYNVRNLKGYNAKIDSIQDMEGEDKPQKMPQIIIIIDELADLMMVSPGEVEDAICRLAQLARAAGIHLVIATQRPSVNVITGLIKANVPSRIAFAVSSGVDSRTIIDMYGAEKLLGKGDMLFYPSGVPKPQRVQGAFVSDQEVAEVVEFLSSQGMETEYRPDIESRMAAPAAAPGGDQPKNNGRDEYFEQAGKFIIEKEKASIGMLQRMYKIGFNRAARIMDQLAEFGVVGEEEGTKPRKVLITMEEFEDLLAQERG